MRDGRAGDGAVGPGSRLAHEQGPGVPVFPVRHGPAGAGAADVVVLWHGGLGRDAAQRRGAARDFGWLVSGPVRKPPLLGPGIEAAVHGRTSTDSTVGHHFSLCQVGAEVSAMAPPETVVLCMQADFSDAVSRTFFALTNWCNLTCANS